MANIDLILPKSTKDMDSTSTPLATAEIQADGAFMDWPTVAPLLMESVVGAFSAMSDEIVPRPFNDMAAVHSQSRALPEVDKKEFFKLSDAAIERFKQAAQLGQMLAFDLGNIPIVQEREELTIHKMSALCEASEDRLETTISELKLIIDDLKLISNLGGTIFRLGRSNVSDNALGQLTEDAIFVLQKHGISVSADATTADLYKKIAQVWDIVEKTMIRTSLQWIHSCLETQRMRYYFQVGEHLRNEALCLSRAATGKSPITRFNSDVTQLLEVANSPYLLEWPVLPTGFNTV